MGFIDIAARSKTSDGLVYRVPGRRIVEPVEAGDIESAINFNTDDTKWKTQGHCASNDYDPEWWFVGDDPKFNNKNIPKAAAICSGCPVMTQCDEMHTDSDKKWIVVAGKIPSGFKVRPEKTHCANGHDVRVPGSRYSSGNCRQCAREKKARARKRSSVVE